MERDKLKVGIITMISDNYGNRLQNYALQQVLSNLGCSVETLNNPWEDSYNPRMEKLKSTIKWIIYLLTKQPKRYSRKIKFEYFNKKYIQFSKFWINNCKDRKKAADYYDIFICGSDQVWNSESVHIDGRYFADFSSKEKRFSYAASLGINEIISDRIDEFRIYLNGMSGISVREKESVIIIENIANKSATCHIDPTLLLSSKEWNNMLQTELKSSKRYIFCYFLGEISKNIFNEIKKYAKENEFVIKIIAPGVNNELINIGPTEFISLIKNSEYIFTDSFHGTVFSVIFEKPFYVYNRSNVKSGMSTRITSLLEILDLSDRFAPTFLDKDIMNNVDFTNAKKIIEIEREKSIEYLKQITNR